MEKQIKEKNGVLGLNTVKAFIIVLLALAIIGVVFIVVLGLFSSDSFLTGNAPKSGTINVLNETLISVNETGTNNANTNRLAVTCSWNSCVNESGSDDAIPADNLSFSGCSVTYIGEEDIDGYNNSLMRCTYDYDYRKSELITGVTDNATDGAISFFDNTTTFFSLLVVVVIILIVSLVVVVVNRFGGGGAREGTTNTTIGGGSSMGSGPQASL